MANRTQKRNNVYEFRRPAKGKQRSQIAKKRAAHRRRIRRLTIIGAGAFVGIVLLVFVIWVNTYKNAQEVFVDEKHIGFIKGLDIKAKDLQDTAVAKIVADIGTNIRINETVTLKPVHAKKAEMSEINPIVSEIQKNLTYVQEAAIISVEGVEVATVRSMAEAEKIMSEIKRAYDTEEQNIIQWETLEEYSLTTRYVSSEDIMTSDTVRNILMRSVEVEETYVIAPGDSLWQIAVKANMSLDKLIQLNEERGITADTPVRVGQEITLIVQKPLLSIRTVEEIQTTTVINRSVDYKENPAMPSSYRLTLVEGSDGESVITTHVIRENGRYIRTDEIRTEITVEPIDDVIEIGTRG